MGYGQTVRLLHSLLVMAQTERPARKELVGDDMGWSIYERQVMLDSVNDLRKEKHLPPVTMEQVQQAETYASGHWDYTATFAVQCAKLVFGVTPG